MPHFAYGLSDRADKGDPFYSVRYVEFDPYFRLSFSYGLVHDLYLAGKKNWENGSYSFSLVYYFAMIWDILIRFEWIVYTNCSSNNSTRYCDVVYIGPARKF
ncbi:AVN_HP_G0120150.mRNA.1.CDS.1 [Saccharomyces cerevisiae]|nr:AVN_HP_G0120150.mRNA.1.CDS.1 [Saccharomyces cerevisiae]CAI6997232.1 AVN_HP_G0120150.mRNA.1.CDS.1 [Saccharomyces cerevisiae]